MKDAKGKIVLVANTGWYLFNFRRNLVERLSREGFEVILVAPNDEYLVRLAELGYRTHEVFLESKGQNFFNDMRTFWCFMRLFEEIKPTAVLSFTVKPNIYVGFTTQLLDIPLISTVTGLGTAFIAGGLLQRIVVELYRFSQRRCKVIVFQNRDDKRLFEKLGIGHGRKTMIIRGSGVNTDYFYFSPYPTGRVRKVLFVGRFIRDKGVRELVEAAKIIASKREKIGEVTFQFLGGLAPQNRTSLTAKDIDLWKQLDFIEVLDTTEDVRQAIHDAYCVVLPSYREGLPKVLIEAGSMGRPVIATNVPGCRDVVQDRENGLLCEPQSSTDLAIKIEQMLNFLPSEWSDMATAGRRRVKCFFDESVIVDEYCQLLQEITSSS